VEFLRTSAVEYLLGRNICRFMKPHSTRRHIRWALLSGFGILLILICIAYVDRPVADFAHNRLGGTQLFGVAVAILTSLLAVLVLMALFVVGCGAWYLAGWRLPDWARLLLQAVLAAGVSLLVALSLKVAIGRSEADPLYVSSHIHEFRPFRGDNDHKAFPSATMAFASAFLGVLCWDSAGRRLFAGALLILLSACLVATNSHWIADILGGLYLGIVVDAVILRAARSAGTDTTKTGT
jgi:PAP2 superfamily